MKKICLFLVMIHYCIFLIAQETGNLPASVDSTPAGKQTFTNTLIKDKPQRERWHSVILPASLITYGFVSLNSDPLKDFDNGLKEEIREDHPHFHTPVDNYLQYAPAMSVYVLNAMGIKGKNNFRDRSMIYLMANAMMGVTVQSVKKITRIQRPDGFGHNAFPSGHTATAFVAAEFLRQEYKDVSPWYGVAGYTAATITGILRMYNNKHWFRDLLPGAGIGILSTRVAYWIYPSVKKALFKDKPMNAMIVPYYQDKVAGLSLSFHFPH